MIPIAYVEKDLKSKKSKSSFYISDYNYCTFTD